MDFKKVTISLPKNLYNEGMNLVSKGLFSNFSDLVRSGIRGEFKELRLIMDDFDEKFVYEDEELLLGVKQSLKEVKAGRGKILKNDDELNDYLEDL